MLSTGQIIRGVRETIEAERVLEGANKERVIKEMENLEDKDTVKIDELKLELKAFKEEYETTYAQVFDASEDNIKLAKLILQQQHRFLSVEGLEKWQRDHPVSAAPQVD